MLRNWQSQFVDPSLGIGHSWQRQENMGNRNGCQHSVQGGEGGGYSPVHQKHFFYTQPKYEELDLVGRDRSAKAISKNARILLKGWLEGGGVKYTRNTWVISNDARILSKVEKVRKGGGKGNFVSIRQRWIGFKHNNSDSFTTLWWVLKKASICQTLVQLILYEISRKIQNYCTWTLFLFWFENL